MAMAMAMAMTSTMTTQFQLLRIPTKFPVTSFNFQTPKCLVFANTSGAQIRGSNLICEAGSGLEASVAESADSISVKKAEIVVESQDSDTIKVRVDLSGAETQRMFDLVLTNLARTAPPIPGFRREKRGKTTKVPKSFLLVQLGEERVSKFVLEEIVSSSMAQYVNKEKLKVKENKINTTQSAQELKSAFKPGTPFGFNAVIQLDSISEP